MNRTSYQIYEDNGGGLHLIVFLDGHAVDGITNLEHAKRGEWETVKDSLSENAVMAISRWEGHFDAHGFTAKDLVKTIESSEYGYAIVCDNGELFIDKMGRAAQHYFGIDTED